MPYKIYVSNVKASLYNPKNEVALFNVQNSLKLNGVPASDSTDWSKTRGEGQIWSFIGNKKPIGKYVGYEIIDYADNYLFVYDILFLFLFFYHFYPAPEVYVK